MHLETPRADLLRALLRCDSLAHKINEAIVRGSIARAEMAEMAEAARCLLVSSEMLDPAAPEHFRATGYGVPAWLCVDGGHGILAAFDLLASTDLSWPIADFVDGEG